MKLSDYRIDEWRLLHMGAQPIPPALVKHWRRYFPGMQYDTSFGLSDIRGAGAC